jgi:hypothetical protein
MDDELSITDLIDFFLETWVSLLAAALGAMGVGFALSMALPKQYEIKALVQIAEVGGLGRAEPPAVVIERIKTDGFRARVGQALGDAQVTATIKIDPVRNTELVQLTTRAESAERALAISKAYVAALAQVHDEKVSPYLERMQLHLQSVEAELARATAMRDGFAARMMRSASGAAGSSSGSSSGDVILKGSLLQTQENLVRSLSDQAFNLRNQFDENRTFPTRLFVEPVVSAEISPVFPRPELFAGLGFLLGGFLMLLMQVLRRVKRPQTQPASDLPTPA